MCSKKSICWLTLKFGKTSNFGKGDTPYATLTSYLAINFASMLDEMETKARYLTR